MHVCKKSGLLGPRWWLVFHSGSVLALYLGRSRVTLDWCPVRGDRRTIVACSRAVAVRRIVVGLGILWAVWGVIF